MPDANEELLKLLRMLNDPFGPWVPEMPMLSRPPEMSASEEFARDIVFRLKATEMQFMPLADPRTVVLFHESIDPPPESDETAAERQKRRNQDTEQEYGES